MPLDPLLIRFVTPLFAGDSLLAALVLSTIFCASALILFYELVSRQHEKQEAFRSVIALMLFPTAFFLCAGYTESLFLTLVFCFWHFALKRRWFIAAIFGSLATVTRLQGIVLTPIMYWMMLASLLPETDSKPREQVRQVGKLLLGSSRDKTQLSRYKFEWVAPLPPIIVGLGYQLSLKIAGFNTITGLLQTGWNIRTVPPWIGFYQFIQRLLTTKFIYMDWVDLALFVFVLALSVIGLRHVDVGYSLYFWLTLSIFFMRGTPHLLASYSRYLLALFPLFTIIARTPNKILRALIFEISFGLRMLLLWIFLSGSWVT